ncbi:MAG: Tannase and feruloyl esterase [Cirrosporium novae-zelandiae]|nr:MAG: Tannase and feruloyl esterase [Cirrosporium novae-zelandiae]
MFFIYALVYHVFFWAPSVLSAPLNSTAQQVSCTRFANSLNIDNTIVISSEHVIAGSNITMTGGQTVCQITQKVDANVCRVALNVTTSSSSSNLVEVWLPDNQSWNGRFISTGNGALKGCIQYDDLSYTTSMGFATTGDNGGHDGGTGEPFLNNNEVVLDFSWRALHSAVVVGKELTQLYYGTPHKKSYYLGCSTGGRQGLKSVQMFPSDFDGVSAGAPAADFNHLTDWSGHFYLLTGANTSDPRFLTYDQWTTVHNEVLKQCDKPLDGVADGIVEDPSICDFEPETLICTSNSTNSSTCLTSIQAQTVRNVFAPLYGSNNRFLYPRLTPSAGLPAAASGGILSGTTDTPALGWFRYAVYNDSSFDVTTLDESDYDYSDSLDELHGNISSWSGDLSSFRDRGGKLITYHGMSDPTISGENSMRYYNHVSQTMNSSSTSLDSFYRFFRISGMYHCTGGNGAWAFGQKRIARNATMNVLKSLVAWVENGTAPDVMVGTKWVDDDETKGVEIERPHCRYPYRTTYVGGNPNVTAGWTCKLS